MWIDACYRTAYRVAYQGARIYWRIARPSNRGALVTIWHQGRVLLVQNSYVSYRSLPGGYVRSGESPLDAAVRELKEEISLDVRADELKPALDHTHVWEGRNDHVVIFRLDVDVAPMVQVDNREVVSAKWFSPEEALAENLFPPLRRLVEAEAQKGPN